VVTPHAFVMSGLSALLDGEVPESGTEASDAFERAEAGRAQAESDANEGRRRLEVPPKNLRPPPYLDQEP